MEEVHCLDTYKARAAQSYHLTSEQAPHKRVKICEQSSKRVLLHITSSLVQTSQDLRELPYKTTLDIYLATYLLTGS